MSKIGKKPIEIPANVKVQISGNEILIEGEKGSLKKQFPPEIEIQLKGNQILVNLSPNILKKKRKKAKALWGTWRQLIANMIVGVTKGFEKKLEIEGVGYRAFLEGNDLVLKVGFSHLVKIKCPEGIKFSVEKNIISVSGIDKELVGNVAAKIRDVWPAEPYKGKGIKYVGEVIRRKLGKKAIAATK